MGSNLKPSVRHVGHALAVRVDYVTLECEPSQARIALDTGLSIATVQRAIAELRRRRFLHVTYRREHKQASIYKLMNPRRPARHS